MEKTVLHKDKYCSVLTMIKSKPRVWSSHRQVFSSVFGHFSRQGAGKAEPKFLCRPWDPSLWWEPRTPLSKATSSLDAALLWTLLTLSKDCCSLGKRDPPAFLLVKSRSPEHLQGVVTRTWAKTSSEVPWRWRQVRTFLLCH